MKIPYDDYNGNIRKDGILGTLTTEAPRDAFRHGHKIILVYEVHSWMEQRRKGECQG